MDSDAEAIRAQPGRLSRGELLAPAPFSTLLSTWVGVGLLPGPTGTWGSAAAVVVAELLFARFGLAAIAALAVFATAAGIPAATRTARLLGRKDPKEVVVDEVAGQAITLVGFHAAFPGSVGGAFLGGVVAAFLLFRFLDIWKPGPVRRLEALPGGTGIVLDDVAAGAIGALVFVAARFVLR